jgi:hypothetical protein
MTISRNFNVILASETLFQERIRVMVFNANFNNISVISWWLVLCGFQVNT